MIIQLLRSLQQVNNNLTIDTALNLYALFFNLNIDDIMFETFSLKYNVHFSNFVIYYSYS